MATSFSQCVKKCLLDQKKVCYLQSRTHKFRTKNPRPKPMPRRIFEEITKPIYPTKPYQYLPGSCLDPRVTAEKEPNPFEEFLVHQLERTVWTNEMLIICHRLPVSRLRLSELKKDFYPHGIWLNTLNNTHMKRVIRDTKLANLEPLLDGHNMLINCKEPKINELQSCLKKYPELIILGGYISGKLVTQQQLKDLAKLPPLEMALGELVSILNMAAGGRTLSLLNSHQQRLGSNLEQYRKQLEEPEKQE